MAKTVKPVQGIHPEAYDRHAQKCLDDTEDFIMEYFGPECSEFDSGCPTCKMWKLFHQMEEIVAA